MVINQYNSATGHVETVAEENDPTSAQKHCDALAQQDKSTDHVYYVSEQRHDITTTTNTNRK